MVYRLTERYCGAWHDIVEGGETFDHETEQEVISLLNSIGWKNGHGDSLSYREVSDEELEAEHKSWARSMAAMMMGE